MLFIILGIETQKWVSYEKLRRGEWAFTCVRKAEI
jgi:hypothetical protein